MRHAPSRVNLALRSFPRTAASPSQNKFAIPRLRVPSDVRVRQVRPKISAALESPPEFPVPAIRSILAPPPKPLLSQRARSVPVWLRATAQFSRVAATQNSERRLLPRSRAVWEPAQVRALEPLRVQK